MKKFVCLLLTVLLLLCGCSGEEMSQETPEKNDVLQEIPGQSNVWKETPQLIPGQLEYERLEVEPWYCGRLEFTGGGCWAETELGYYYYDSGTSILKYADKADLSKWVPVCNKPTCPHTETTLNCNAVLEGNTFLIRNERIYYATNTGGKNEDLHMEEGDARVIASRALDGSDPRIEYYIEEAIIPNGGFTSDLLTSTHWILTASVFNPDGTYTNRLYRRTETSLEILAESITTEKNFYLTGDFMILDGMIYGAFSGDAFFSSDLLTEQRGDPKNSVYRYVNGDLQQLDITGFEWLARYLSGNTLRLYRPNDGFYDLDLTTRQETKVADSQLPDSGGVVLLPNCITERNEEKYLLFDGTLWREIQIPQELQGQNWYVTAVASDRLLFTCYESSGYRHLGQVMLGQDTLVLEYCGRIS